MVFFIDLACSQNYNTKLATSEFTKNFPPLTLENVVKIGEIASWTVIDNSPVSNISFNTLVNRLIVVSEQTMKVTTMNVETGEKTSDRNIGTSQLRILGITENGDKLLVGAINQNIENKLRWIAIVDTNTGQLINCLSASCGNQDISSPPPDDIGGIMDSKGDFVVIYNEDSYTLIKQLPDEYASIVLVNSPEEDYWWHIGRIAIDTKGKRLAVIFQEGRIAIQKMPSPQVFPLVNSGKILANGTQGILQNVKFATFDPDGRWLAILQGEELIIWRVSGLNKEVYRGVEANVTNITFSPFGGLLFISTKNEIKIFALSEGRFVSKIDTHDTTAIKISEDNRILFTGDNSGVIHMWGVMDK